MSATTTVTGPDRRSIQVTEKESNISTSARPRAKRRFGARAKLLLALFLVGAISISSWLFLTRNQVSTDDAAIEGHVVQVSPKIASHVKAIYFNDNYVVKQGDLLVELDPRDFDVSFTSAEANVASAQSRVAEAQAQQLLAEATLGQAQADLKSAQATLDNAAADLKRNEQLFATHVIDRREYDNSLASARTSTANVESGQKKVASAQAQLRLTQAEYNTAAAAEKQASAQLRAAQLQVSYTKIYAPFSGRIVKKGVEPGDYVQPGQTLFSLVEPEVWVVANFKETQLKRMFVGQPVKVKVDAVPDREFRGHVESFQDGTGGRFTLLPPENATGNYVKVVQRVPVKIVFDEPVQELSRLWPGESVEPVVDVSSENPANSRKAEPLPPALLGESLPNAR
ncbi:MAG: HlyD family secretion protein [Verrucomicrobia bacterium]|nr:HlyD family secretion protein [Verrucomicrobiota bacterium]